MKYYHRYLLFAVLAGITQYFIADFMSPDITIFDLINRFTFSGEFLMGYFILYTSLMLPMILFQISFSMYIYQHYTFASPYYFSRQGSRFKWYLKECLRLFYFALMYTCILLLTALILAVFSGRLTVDKYSMSLVPYFIFTYTVWNFMMVLLINILSIKIKPNMAVISVMLSQLIQIKGFDFLAPFLHVETHTLSPEGGRYLQMIPFAHNILAFHSSENPILNSKMNKFDIHFPLSRTVILFSVLLVLIFALGAYIILRHDILSFNDDIE